MRLIVSQEGIGEVELLSSRFKAVCGKLENSADFKEIYENYRKSCPKADHYGYAYVDEEYSKSSDDGEPGGSAGRPLLELLKDAGIVRGYIIVARYFGGTKLGIPRLRRCFVEAGKQALDNAVKAKEVKKRYVYLSLDYSAFESLKRLMKNRPYQMEDIKFGISVSLLCFGDDTILSFLEECPISFLDKKDLGSRSSWEEIA